MENLFLSLSEHLVEQILLRLSVKSLLCCKCVCKSWLWLISDPHFAKTHFDVAAPTHRVLLKFCTKDFLAHSIDIEAPLNHAFEVPITLPSPSPFVKHSYQIDIVGSCRGFLLLTATQRRRIYFLLWNPSTGFRRRFISRFLFQGYKRPLRGIGYDSSKDDYVVAVIPVTSLSLRRSTEVHCFSLRNNSWSCIETDVPYQHMGGHKFGLFLNGALHWLVFSHDRGCMIIAFDVKERKLSEILLPPELANVPFFRHDLKVMGGCLCLWFPGSGTQEPPIIWIQEPEIWILKEYKVHSSWTRSSLVPDCCYSLSDGSLFYPICFTKNDKILGYDRHLQTLVKLHGIGKEPEYRRHRLFKDSYSTLRCCLYTESLLSLPQPK
ncbi:hypothetical protein VNO78_03232 [Psophocarpus tetragonolobus]|uniref:F-box domain-containing protein n=1 Tax=Psophocarpus tetragonolobus TaxID=3891 RepID=A0AAN9T029_PSOTE